MNKADFISLAGLRPDGRRAREIRRVRCRFGVFKGADGSAYLEMGQTKVIAIVKGPREVNRRADMRHDQAIVRCEYKLAPFSGSERKKRRPSERKVLEVAMGVKEVFEGAMMLHLYPRTQIDIYLHVIQVDGGALPACINATSLALVDAGVALKDLVSACSAGYLDGTPVMAGDHNYVEQSIGAPYMTMAMLPEKGQILLAKMESRLPLEIFEEVLQTATDSCLQQVHEVLRAAVREHAGSLLSSQLSS
ncbi:unnamed protein product [Discosporangium mesarthrocarpum]